MPTLFLKCRSCRTEFPTPIAVTESGLQGVLITGLAHRCPTCGAQHKYSTHEYFVPKAVSETGPGSGSATFNGDRAATEAARQSAEVERLEGFGVQRSAAIEGSGRAATHGADGNQ